MSVLLRKQWMENEKLSYPIVLLPVAMTTNPVRFLKNRWMWAGFALAAAWGLALYPLVYFPMVLGITRAEVGPPLHNVIYTDPGRTSSAMANAVRGEG